MPDSLFPRTADNTFRGHRIALWILGVITLLNGVIGFNSTFNTRQVATTADGIPLDKFPPDAAQTVVELFALLGISRIVIFLLCAIVLFRYRSLVPLMFAVLLVSQLASRILHHYQPPVTTGSPSGSIVISTLLGLTIIGLGLSLWDRKRPLT
jgi:ABC-type transport system involved in cytochrome c biogenesis permease component